MNVTFKSVLLFAAIILAKTMASPCSAIGAKVTVAAASDLTYALAEAVAYYGKINPGAIVDVTFGSSGKLSTQISQGAPYDLFMSADITYPKQLVEKGAAIEPVVPYGLGRIVLWSATYDVSQMSLSDLHAAKFKHIAIADPAHAPYGLRAKEALEKTGLWNPLQPRLVVGENIAQAAQFVYSGNAEAGIIALSVALSPELAKKGAYSPVPDSLHQPLLQAFVVTGYGRTNNFKATNDFVLFLVSPGAREIMGKFGFSLPGKPGTLSTAK